MRITLLIVFCYQSSTSESGGNDSAGTLVDFGCSKLACHTNCTRMEVSFKVHCMLDFYGKAIYGSEFGIIRVVTKEEHPSSIRACSWLQKCCLKLLYVWSGPWTDLLVEKAWSRCACFSKLSSRSIYRRTVI